MMNDTQKITVGSMFAGIGGICLGFKQAGCDIIWANEVDSATCKTYRHNFGADYLVEGDIKNINKNSIPHFDILTAGFPCQPFSLARPHKGFEDKRGNLFFQITEVAKVAQPDYIFLENVKRKDSIYRVHDSGIHLAKNRTCPTLTASMGTRKNMVPLVIDDHGYRKLTLRECLDFQGFPKDFYFPNTITIEDAYKQIGNSVCVPVIKRIAEQIKTLYENYE